MSCFPAYLLDHYSVVSRVIVTTFCDKKTSDKGAIDLQYYSVKSDARKLLGFDYPW